MNNFRLLIGWEIKKYKSLGFGSAFIFGFFGLYFYYVPRIMLIICNMFPDTKMNMMYSLGALIIRYSCFVFINLIFTLVYYLKNPAIEVYKSNPELWPWENKKDWALLQSKLIKSLIFTELILMPTVFFLGGLRAKYYFSQELPDFLEILKQIVFFSFIEDFFFY